VAPGSTTTNRNFKVKHGLDVADGGTFGSTVTVATPTENLHAATKLYVDSKPILVSTATSAPAEAVNGQLYIDTVTDRLAFYVDGAWHTVALLQDTAELQQHIHDTAIDGTGLVVSIFKDAGFYYEAGDEQDAGFYNTNSWELTWDGGIATEVYN
jgi:hypothetical protein